MSKLARAVAAFSMLVVASVAANAAEKQIPVKAPPAPMPPPFTWTGFYIGGNLGVASGHHSWSDSIFGLNFSNSDNGNFIGGGQVGGNYQINNFVIGVEGTFDWAQKNNNATTITVPALGGNLIQVTANDKWVSTAAARLGWAWIDRALFYVKGGGGWIGADSVTVTNLTTGASITGSTNNTRSGWLVGAGLEWAFANNWSAKVEYDYLGLGSRSFTVPVGSPFPRLVGDTFITGNNNNVQMLMVGLNYRFNWGGYPTQY